MTLRILLGIKLKLKLNSTGPLSFLLLRLHLRGFIIIVHVLAFVLLFQFLLMLLFLAVAVHVAAAVKIYYLHWRSKFLYNTNCTKHCKMKDITHIRILTTASNPKLYIN